VQGIQLNGERGVKQVRGMGSEQLWLRQLKLSADYLLKFLISLDSYYLQKDFVP
jgi:hypothetical protein